MVERRWAKGTVRKIASREEWQMVCQCVQPEQEMNDRWSVSVYNQSKEWMTGCHQYVQQEQEQSVGDLLLPAFIVDMTPDWWNKLKVSLIIIIICHAGKAWAVMDCHFTWAPEVWIFFWIMLFGQDIQVFISMPSFCSFPIKFDSSHKVSSLSCLSG